MRVRSNRFWADGSGDVRVELVYRTFYDEVPIRGKAGAGILCDFYDFSTAEGRIVRRLAKGSYQDVFSGKVFKSNDPEAP
jgi:hypothetical protein